MRELEVIQQAGSLKVLVIGDSCIDEFVYGSCERLSPEAPVPVLKMSRITFMPGMAGNVTENVTAFTKNVELMCQFEEIKKTRYVDSRSNQHIMRFDIEPSDIKPAYLSTSKISRDIRNGKFDLVIISDYDKGFLNRRQVISLTSRLADGMKLYVDTKKKDVGCYQNSFIKLNERESMVSGDTLHDTSSLITTLGPNGSRYEENNYPSKKVDVFDVSGAGDTFLATFAIFHVITKDIPGAISFANKCSSIVVQKQGTYAIKRDDLS